jgi:hypothetical protein
MLKDQNNNIVNNITNDVNDVPIAGTDLFVDSEDLLNELTDSDLGQIVGGNLPQAVLDDLEEQSHLSILLCR